MSSGPPQRLAPLSSNLGPSPSWRLFAASSAVWRGKPDSSSSRETPRPGFLAPEHLLHRPRAAENPRGGRASPHALERIPSTASVDTFEWRRQCARARSYSLGGRRLVSPVL